MVLSVLFLNSVFEIDYGFTGSLIALLASVPCMPKEAPEYLKRFDRTRIKVLLVGVGLIPLGLIMGASQPFAFAPIPLDV